MRKAPVTRPPYSWPNSCNFCHTVSIAPAPPAACHCEAATSVTRRPALWGGGIGSPSPGPPRGPAEKAQGRPSSPDGRPCYRRRKHRPLVVAGGDAHLDLVGDLHASGDRDALADDLGNGLEARHLDPPRPGLGPVLRHADSIPPLLRP